MLRFPAQCHKQCNTVLRDIFQKGGRILGPHMGAIYIILTIRRPNFWPPVFGPFAIFVQMFCKHTSLAWPLLLLSALHHGTETELF